MQEKLLSSCRGKGGGRHGSKFAVEGLVQEGLLQFLQGGEFAFVEASEVLGFYAQVVGGLLAVISAGIAQRAGGGEGQQKLCGLMQGSQLPRRWPCCEGLLDTLIITRPRPLSRKTQLHELGRVDDAVRQVKPLQRVHGSAQSANKTEFIEAAGTPYGGKESIKSPPRYKTRLQL